MFSINFTSLIIQVSFYLPEAYNIFGEGSGTLLQYSCLENPMDGGVGSEKSGKLEVGGASRDSTGFGALEEGLISS